MPPEAAAILADFVSRDPHRIWAASGAVRHCQDRGVLAPLAARIAEITQATEGIDLGGGLRANSTHLSFALRKLAFVRDSDACLCALWPTDDLADPERLAASGSLVIDTMTVHRADDFTDYACHCRACGKSFAVQDNTGYHYTTWRWRALD